MAGDSTRTLIPLRMADEEIMTSSSSSSSSSSASCSPSSSSDASPKLKFGIDSILEPGFGRRALRPSLQCAPPSSAFPAWVFCTRYSDRPSSGSRARRGKKRESSDHAPPSEDEKRPRTAFTQQQLERLKTQFTDSRYLTEKQRQALAHELGLNESQIKIWFQNKRAKLKKASSEPSPSLPLSLQMGLHGLYSTPSRH